MRAPWPTACARRSRKPQGPPTPNEILISEAQIQARIAELAVEIRRDHGPGTPIHFVAVLKGAFMFLADLMREMKGEVTCDFIALSSYGASTKSSGEVRLLK